MSRDVTVTMVDTYGRKQSPWTRCWLIFAVLLTASCCFASRRSGMSLLQYVCGIYCSW